MKIRILTIAFMAFTVFGFSQEIKTIFQNDSLKTTSYGGYGGPLIQVSQINNGWGMIMGGKGGVVINRKFAFGGIGGGLISNNNFVGDNLKGEKNASLNLSYGAGGLFFEYIFKLENPVHISIPINFMAGGISVNERLSDTEIESCALFILEPGINLEFNISQNFISGINVSYRQAFGSSLININDEDISGVCIGFVFKFGSF